MGRKKGKAKLNPADVQRKRAKARQKAKNKQTREFTKQVYKSNDPKKIMEELKQLARTEAAGYGDHNTAKQKQTLLEAYKNVSQRTKHAAQRRKAQEKEEAALREQRMREEAAQRGGMPNGPQRSAMPQSASPGILGQPPPPAPAGGILGAPPQYYHQQPPRGQMNVVAYSQYQRPAQQRPPQTLYQHHPVQQPFAGLLGDAPGMPPPAPPPRINPANAFDPMAAPLPPPPPPMFRKRAAPAPVRQVEAPPPKAPVIQITRRGTQLGRSTKKQRIIRTDALGKVIEEQEAEASPPATAEKPSKVAQSTSSDPLSLFDQYAAPAPVQTAPKAEAELDDEFAKFMQELENT